MLYRLSSIRATHGVAQAGLDPFAVREGVIAAFPFGSCVVTRLADRRRERAVRAGCRCLLRRRGERVLPAGW
jgi:hypothetical protein